MEVGMTLIWTHRTRLRRTVVRWKQGARHSPVKRHAMADQLLSQRRRGVKVEERTAILLNHVIYLLL
jgi:hypothetical protein